MRRLLPLAVFLGVSVAACAGPAQPSGVAQAEHDLLYGVGTRTEVVSLHDGRADWRSAPLDAEVYPRLHRAWEAGEAPSSGLFGRDHAQWLRRLRIEPAEDGGFLLVASALAPHPVRLSLVLRDGDDERTLARAPSEAWSPGSHFARVQSKRALEDGDVFLVRVEGAHQVHESRLRIRL